MSTHTNTQKEAQTSHETKWIHENAQTLVP